MPLVWRPLANWKTHLEEPYESRGSRTVPRGAGGEIPLAYSTVRRWPIIKGPLFYAFIYL